MPIYEFRCKSCNKKYEDLTIYDESGVYPNTKCLECGSFDKTICVSSCAAFPNKDSHDHKFWTKIDKDRGIRPAAEAAQGSDPYNSIDDLSGGKYFGEVQ